MCFVQIVWLLQSCAAHPPPETRSPPSEDKVEPSIHDVPEEEPPFDPWSESTCTIDIQAGETLWTPKDSFEVTFHNASPVVSQATLFIGHQTQHGHFEARVVHDILKPDGAHTSILTVPSFRLPNTTFDVSGFLELSGLLISRSGIGLCSFYHALYFHKIPQGWAVYDDATRISNYNRGALSDRAKATKADMEQQLERAHGRKQTVDMFGPFP